MTPNDIPNLSEVLAALKAGTATFDDVREAARRHRFSTIDTKVRSVQELAERWEYAPVAGSFRDPIEVLRWGKVLTKEQVDVLREEARFLPVPTPANVAALAREYLRGEVDWDSVLRLAAATTFTRGEPEVYGRDNSLDLDSWKDTVGLISHLPYEKRKQLRATAKFVDGQ